MNQANQKFCKKCERNRPLFCFSPRKDAKDGLAYWCNECKTKATSSGKNRKLVIAAYYQRNAEKCVERSLASMAKKPEYYAEKKKLWQQKNHSVILQQRRERYAANPSSEIERVRRRQGKVRGAKQLTLGHQAEIDGIYRFCKIFRGFEVDHIIPLNGKAVSGLHVPGNLQVITVRANRQKSNKFAATEELT